MNPEVTFEERGAVAHVRLERPAKRNALTRAMLERLWELDRMERVAEIPQGFVKDRE